ncbi:MAG: PRC-barrel domain-containing protein [Bacillota bacterium]
MTASNVRVRSLMGKEVIYLKDGSFLGKVQSAVVNSGEKRVTGITIKLKGILSGKSFIPYSLIQSFGVHSITVKDEFDPEVMVKVSEEKEIIDMPVITITGTMLGNVDNFSFDQKDGSITQYILTGGIVHDSLEGKGILRGDQISRIGKDVIIANADVDENDLEELDVEYTEMQENISSALEQTKEIYEDAKGQLAKSQEKLEKGLENAKTSAENTWQQVGNKAKSITEEWTKKIKEQADKLSGEAKELFAEAQEATQIQLEKLNSVKNKWQEKLSNIKGKPQDEIGESLLNEIRNKTVSKVLYDNEGSPIIIPGQTINDAVLKKALEKGKIHELFMLAAAKDVEDEIEKIEQ